MSSIQIIESLRSEFDPFMDGKSYKKDWDEMKQDLEAESDNAPRNRRFGVDDYQGEYDGLCY